MAELKKEWIEKIYAGWLAKIIGIRLGAPVEGWTYEQIKSVYGKCGDYPVDYKRFAADDDSNAVLSARAGREYGKRPGNDGRRCGGGFA